MRCCRIALIITAVAALALTFAVIAGAEGRPAISGSVDQAEQVVAEVASRAPALLSSYIRIDTTNPPGNEAAGARFLAEILRAEGIEPSIFESEPGRSNLYARLPGSGAQRPVLLLSHIDVVPAEAGLWAHDPFGGHNEEGVIYGRGALDCKGVGIVETLAMVALKRLGEPLARDVVILATADEEAGGHLGAGWFVREHNELIEDVEYVLNEGGFVHRSDDLPLVFNINAAEKAPCWFRIVATGQPGHASRPTEETSVTRLVSALDTLLSWERPLEVGPIVAGYYRAYAAIEPGRATEFGDLARALEEQSFRRWFMSDPGAAALVHDTITPTVLRASPKTNVIPGSAMAEVDSRLLPGHDCGQFLDQVRERIGSEHVRIEPTGVAFAASESPLDNDLTAAIARLSAAEERESVVLPGLLAGFTDSHWFREKGIAAYGFVPIDVTAEQRAAIHGPDESVDADALQRAVGRLVGLLLELSR